MIGVEVGVGFAAKARARASVWARARVGARVRDAVRGSFRHRVQGGMRCGQGYDHWWS